VYKRQIRAFPYTIRDFYFPHEKIEIFVTMSYCYKISLKQE